MAQKRVTQSPADKAGKNRPKVAGIGKKTQFGTINSGANRRGGKGGFTG